MAGRATSIGFPTTVGPFTMSRVQLGEAINGFYRAHQFPRPDPSSNENSMAGVDLSMAGFGLAEIIFCQLSPLHRITLDDETKEAALIPKDAAHFAFAYPAVLDGVTLPGRLPAGERAFLEYGGFVYLDERRLVVGTNGLAQAPLGTLGLMFGRAQPLAAGPAEALTRQGRFQEITLEALSRQGASHFAWIRPGEFDGQVAGPNGCFAYKFRGGAPAYFPVVDRPVFTPQMLEEELDSTEAWVVVRSSVPEVEVPLVFDKAVPVEENAQRSAHASALCLPGAEVVVVRAGGKGTYAEWQQDDLQGSVEDPWIFQVTLPDNSGRAH